MDKDFEIGCDLKDELVPMAYEYFLNIIDHDDDGSDSLQE